MTAPRAPQWQLTVPIRFAALALLCVGLAFLVQGWLSIVLWIAAVVFLVIAAVKLAKVWKNRPKNSLS
jgi:membrane protein implicated in regulation of membrane protease activity